MLSSPKYRAETIRTILEDTMTYATKNVNLAYCSSSFLINLEMNIRNEIRKLTTMTRTLSVNKLLQYYTIKLKCLDILLDNKDSTHYFDKLTEITTAIPVEYKTDNFSATKHRLKATLYENFSIIESLRFKGDDKLKNLTFDYDIFVDIKASIENDLLKLLIYNIVNDTPMDGELKAVLMRYLDCFSEQMMSVDGICSAISVKFIRNMLLEDLRINNTFLSMCNKFNSNFNNQFDLSIKDELDLVFVYVILMKMTLFRNIDVLQVIWFALHYLCENPLYLKSYDIFHPITSELWTKYGSVKLKKLQKLISDTRKRLTDLRKLAYANKNDDPEKVSYPDNSEVYLYRIKKIYEDTKLTAPSWEFIIDNSRKINDLLHDIIFENHTLSGKHKGEAKYDYYKFIDIILSSNSRNETWKNVCFDESESPYYFIICLVENFLSAYNYYVDTGFRAYAKRLERLAPDIHIEDTYFTQPYMMFGIYMLGRIIPVENNKSLVDIYEEYFIDPDELRYLFNKCIQVISSPKLITEDYLIYKILVDEYNLLTDKYGFNRLYGLDEKEIKLFAKAAPAIVCNIFYAIEQNYHYVKLFDYVDRNIHIPVHTCHVVAVDEFFYTHAYVMSIHNGVVSVLDPNNIIECDGLDMSFTIMNDNAHQDLYTRSRFQSNNNLTGLYEHTMESRYNEVVEPNLLFFGGGGGDGGGVNLNKNVSCVVVVMLLLLVVVVVMVVVVISKSGYGDDDTSSSSHPIHV